MRRRGIDYLILVGAAIAGLWLGWCLSLEAHGHEHNVPFADWFNSRKMPDAPSVSCCGEADQYYVRSYAASATPGQAFRAVVDDKAGGSFEIDVPTAKVDWNSVNPTGRGVIFVTTTEVGRSTLCFIPGTGV